MHMDEYLPLRDVVFNTLRAAILKGELKPGERLMEIALAEKDWGSAGLLSEKQSGSWNWKAWWSWPPGREPRWLLLQSGLNDVLEVRKGMEVLAVSLAASGSRKRNWTDWTR